MKLLRFAVAVALLCAPLAANAQTIRGSSRLSANQAVVNVPCTGANSEGTCQVQGTIIVDPYTGKTAAFNTYALASNQTITSGGCTTPVTNIAGGSYLATIVASAWNASTVTLQALAPDGTTYLTVAGASWTANATIGVVVGANATLRLCAASGSPTGVYALLS